jgi:hypothetical protein
MSAMGARFVNLCLKLFSPLLMMCVLWFVVPVPKLVGGLRGKSKHMPGANESDGVARSLEDGTGESAITFPGATPIFNWSKRIHMQRYSKCQADTSVINLSSQLTTIMHLNGAMMPHIFKSGGTMMMQVVRQHGGQVSTIFNRGTKYSKRDIVKQYSAFEGFRAALVKDPLRRSLSSFHELMSRRYSPTRIGRHLTKQEMRDLANQTFLIDIYRQELEHTAKNGVQRPGVSPHAHFSPQMSFLLGNEGEKLPLDYIGLADDAPQELEFISRIPGLAETVTYKSGPGGQQFGNFFRIDQKLIPEDLVRVACGVYIVDYCCLGFDLPPACRDMSCSRFFPMEE